MTRSAPSKQLIRQIEDSETDIMVTLDLTALYGKVAAARAKTNLRRIVICNMAQAFPFFSGLMFRLAHWWEVAKPSRGTGDVLFDELIDNDGTYEEAEIAPLWTWRSSNTRAGRRANQKA